MFRVHTPIIRSIRYWVAAYGFLHCKEWDNMKCVCVCACVCSGCTPCCISVYQGGLWSIVQVCLCGDLRFVLTWLWEGSQEVPRILRNPKLHYRAYKRPSPVPILSQLYPVHTPTSHFLKIHLNIILPSTPGFPKWSLSLSFPQQNPAYALLLPHTC